MSISTENAKGIKTLLKLAMGIFIGKERRRRRRRTRKKRRKKGRAKRGRRKTGNKKNKLRKFSKFWTSHSKH